MSRGPPCGLISTERDGYIGSDAVVPMKFAVTVFQDPVPKSRDRHFHAHGKTIDQVSLDSYIGPCVVVSVLDKKLIEKKDCEFLMANQPKRVLFRTLSFPDQNNFNTDFLNIVKRNFFKG